MRDGDRMWARLAFLAICVVFSGICAYSLVQHDAIEVHVGPRTIGALDDAVSDGVILRSPIVREALRVDLALQSIAALSGLTRDNLERDH